MRNLNPFHFIVLALSSGYSLSATNTYSVEEAAKKGLIELSIRGKGGYLGDVIEMKIQNLTNKELDLKLKSGRILDSKNNNEQDIVITQGKDIFLSAHYSQTINILGMCAQAHNGAPRFHSEYTIGYLADSNLIKLTSFIDKNKYHHNRTAQQAVWTITDSNSLASINGGSDEDVTIFQNYVSELTGREIPNYEITFRQQNANDLIGRVTKVEGIFEYNLPENSRATLAIYNNAGELVQLLFKDISHRKGRYDLHYTFRTLKLPTGTYYAKMHTNEKLFKEIEISF